MLKQLMTEGPEERLKPPPLSVLMARSQETAPSHTASLPTAYSVALSAPKQEQNLTSRSDRRDAHCPSIH